MIIFLDSITFDPVVIYDVCGLIVFIITLSGFFYNLRGKNELLKSDLENTKSNLKKLEDKVDSTYSKIENKISELEKKIDSKIGGLEQRFQDLPQQILTLFKELK